MARQADHIIALRNGYDTRSVLRYGYVGRQSVYKAQGIQGMLVRGKGKDIGADLQLQKKSGRSSGWINYS